MRRYILQLLVFILSISAVSAIPLNVEIKGGDSPVQLIVLDSNMNEVFNGTINGSVSMDIPQKGVYHVISYYKGVPYSRAVQLNNSVNLSISVYDPVSDVAFLTSPFHHILLRQAGDSFEVVEVFSIQTPENISFKGRVYLNIPENFDSLKSPDIPVWRDEKGFYIDLALPAGETRQFALSYNLRSPTFEKEIVFNTSFLSILIENPDILKNYSNLEPEGVIEFGGKQYYSLFSKNVTSGNVVTLTLSPSALSEISERSEETSRNYFWIGVGIIGAIAIILGYQGYRSRYPDIEELEARKDALLSVLERLEKDYESGEISPEEYARLKARYKRDAMKILEKIDRIKAKEEADHEEEE